MVGIAFDILSKTRQIFHEKQIYGLGKMKDSTTNNN
jgi:hypothetical protein